MEQPRILDIMVTALRAYQTNKNTGNCYEIATILWIGRRMGLTAESYDKIAPFVANIAAYNNKATAKINAAFNALRAHPTGTGFTLDGSQVIDLLNATQDDSVGTGDIIAICADGSRKTISICDAYGDSPGDLRKCLKNPTCKAFGCGAADIATFKATATAARAAYNAEMTAKHGADQTLWKRKPSDAAREACSAVATQTATVFNALPVDERRQRVKALFHSNLDKPADYLAMVRSDWTPSFYRWDCSASLDSTAVPDSAEPVVRASGIYLMVYLSPEPTAAPVAQVQVKFNNGVNSPIHSSWNAVVNLERVFTLSAL